MFFSATLPNRSIHSTHAQLAAWLSAMHAAAVQEQYENPCRPACPDLAYARLVNPVPLTWIPRDRRDPRLHVLGLYAEYPRQGLAHGRPLLLLAFQPGGACICTGIPPARPAARSVADPADLVDPGADPEPDPDPDPDLDPGADWERDCAGERAGDPAADSAASASGMISGMAAGMAADPSAADRPGAPYPTDTGDPSTGDLSIGDLSIGDLTAGDPGVGDSAAAQPGKALGPCCGRCCLVQVWRCADFPLTRDELRHDLERTFDQPTTPSADFPPIGVVERPNRPTGPRPGARPAGPPPDGDDSGATLPENVWLRSQIEGLMDPEDNLHLMPEWWRLRVERVGYMDLQHPRRSFELAAERIVKNLKRRRGR